MTYTERKHCNICDGEAIHLKENQQEGIEEECLVCGWRCWIESWEDLVKAEGIDKAREEWIKNRDSNLNKEIIKELNANEKEKWDGLVKWTNKYFSPDQEEPQQQNQEPTNYQPYLIGGSIGAGIIAFIWLIVILARRD